MLEKELNQSKGVSTEQQPRGNLDAGQVGKTCHASKAPSSVCS